MRISKHDVDSKSGRKNLKVTVSKKLCFVQQYVVFRAEFPNISEYLVFMSVLNTARCHLLMGRENKSDLYFTEVARVGTK